MKSSHCYFCTQPIRDGEQTNLHHPIYKSEGGTDIEPAHKQCHIAFHINKGDFKAWGRIGGQITALTKVWALNLLNVRTDPAHEINRQFYRQFYAH